MSEPSIEELLRAMPDQVEPDAAFAAATRSRVAAELRRGVLDPTETEEIDVVTVSTETTDRSGRRRPARRTLVAAVALAAIVVVGAAIALSDDEEPGSDAGLATDPDSADVSDVTVAPEVTTVVLDPDPPGVPRTFEGGSFDTFALADQPDPYRVVATDDAVWTMTLDGLLVRRDPSTLQATNQISVGAGSMLAADSSSVWVGDTGDGMVKRIDSASAEVVADIETGIAMRPGFRSGRTGQPAGASDEFEFARLGDIDVSDGSVWVSDLDGRLLQIDASTNTVAAELPIEVDAHIVRSSGRFVLLGDQAGKELVTVIDVTDGTVVAELEIDRLIGADLDDEFALVFDQSGVVTRVDLGSGAIETSDAVGDVVRTNLEIPYFPHRPAIGEAGLVVTTRTEVVVVDVDTLEIVRREQADGDQGELTIGPDGTAWIVERAADVIHRLTSVAT